MQHAEFRRLFGADAGYGAPRATGSVPVAVSGGRIYLTHLAGKGAIHSVDLATPRHPVVHFADPDGVVLGLVPAADGLYVQVQEGMRQRLLRFDPSGGEPSTVRLPFDGQFDLVYSISIFTHLPEPMQDAWLGELARVAQAGACLVITTHGRKFFENVPQEDRSQALASGFYHHQVNPTAGLPDFYQAAFHTPEYVRSHWSEYFEIIEVLERAVDDGQDIVVCRKR